MIDRGQEITEQLLSIEQFQRLPEDDGYRAELVRGRLVREPLPGAEHGWLASRLFEAIAAHVRRHDLGLALVETGYLLSDEPPTVRGPDAAFLSRERLPDEIPDGFWPLAPDLAVEVVSPSNSAAEIQDKVLQYLDAGTRVVWVVDPATRSVSAYRSRDDIRILTAGETLDGGDVLPGLTLEISELFEAPKKG
ncbi:MAG: Uma2 family endonuclease [Gemmatimonadetes bacterium]|nr:Uma2 family endonuclease [Gemmatimonadota bacterium]